MLASTFYEEADATGIMRVVAESGKGAHATDDTSQRIPQTFCETDDNVGATYQVFAQGATVHLLGFDTLVSKHHDRPLLVRQLSLQMPQGCVDFVVKTAPHAVIPQSGHERCTTISIYWLMQDRRLFIAKVLGLRMIEGPFDFEHNGVSIISLARSLPQAGKLLSFSCLNFERSSGNARLIIGHSEGTIWGISLAKGDASAHPLWRRDSRSESQAAEPTKPIEEKSSGWFGGLLGKRKQSQPTTSTPAVAPQTATLLSVASAENCIITLWSDGCLMQLSRSSSDEGGEVFTTGEYFSRPFLGTPSAITYVNQSGLFVVSGIQQNIGSATLTVLEAGDEDWSIVSRQIAPDRSAGVRSVAVDPQGDGIITSWACKRKGGTPLFACLSEGGASSDEVLLNLGRQGGRMHIYEPRGAVASVFTVLNTLFIAGETENGLIIRVVRPQMVMSQSEAALAQSSSIQPFTSSPLSTGFFDNLLGTVALAPSSSGLLLASAPSSASDLRSAKAFKQGLEIVGSIRDGWFTFRQLLQSLLSSSPATSLEAPEFEHLRNQFLLLYTQKPGAEAVTEDDVHELIDRVLNATTAELPSFIVSRRCLSSALVSELSHRLIIVALGCVAWLCSSDASLTQSSAPTSVAKVRRCLNLLSVAVAVVASLGPSTPSLLQRTPPGGSRSMVDHLMKALLFGQLADEALFAQGTFAVAQRLLVIAETGGGGGALQAWVRGWRSQYPVLNHFDASALLISEQHSLGGLNAFRFHSAVLRTSDALCSMESRRTAVAMLLSLCNELLPTSDQIEALEAFLLRRTTDMNFVGLFYRTAVLRTIIKRESGNPLGGSLAIDILTALLYDTEQLQSSLAFEEKLDSAVEAQVQILRLETLARLAYSSSERHRFREAVEFLGPLAAQVEQLSEELLAQMRSVIQTIVSTLLAEERGHELLQYSISTPALETLVASEMYREILSPRSAPSANGVVEERLLHSVLILHSFLVQRGAWGTAARLLHDVASSLRSNTQRCTQATLQIALDLLALAGTTLTLTSTSEDLLALSNAQDDDNAPPESFGGFGDSSAGMVQAGSVTLTGLDYEAVTPFSHSELTMLQQRQRLLWCETLLCPTATVDRNQWHNEDLQANHPTDESTAEVVMCELIKSRCWKEALNIAEVWPKMDATLVLHSQVNDFLDAPTDSRDWQATVDYLSKHSTQENGNEPMRLALSTAVAHQNYKDIPTSLKAEAERIDPNLLLQVFLDAKKAVSVSAAIQALEAGIRATQRNSSSTVSPALLDRLWQLSQRLLSSPPAAASRELLDLAKRFQMGFKAMTQ